VLRPLRHRTEDVIAAALNSVKQETALTISGVYHVEPQSSANPLSFPFGDTPDHWHADAPFHFTERSIFWFNFFPAQPLLFERTFAVWALFQMLQLRGRGENNQLVALDGKDRLSSSGVDDFVQVNLNRFTSLSGFFNAAHEAGKHTFTVDPDYLWYGRLLGKV
jgi:hypothetical protein